MPMQTVVDGPISRWTGTSKELRNQFAESVAQLQFADLWRDPGNIVLGPPRIDVQGPWTDGPGNNIQGQVGNQSCAALRIANSLADVMAAHRVQVLQAAQAALNASCRDGQWRNLIGTIP